MMLDGKYLGLIAVFSILSTIPLIEAEASSNPNLFVSAENPQFDNHFAGSMVIEVVVINPNLADTDQGKGEPDVTINGKSLRMVQASDGSWYAYFANVGKAKIADATVGSIGEGLDFGVFCSRDTSKSIVGISLSETDGFALPRTAVGSTNGDMPFSQCTGSPAGMNINNVLRNTKSINTNSNIPTGQIGLDVNAWPLIQLYSFSDVVIRYNPGGSSQQVSLEYDEIPNISMTIDRDLYPSNSEVFLTVNDFQLNQDPTDEDSWTFDVGTISTFYQAYDENGSSAANGGTGLVDLAPRLSNIGFEDNGRLSVTLNSILELQSNNEQPGTSVSDGTVTYSEIITLVEDGPNSGIFDSGDHNNQSVLGILADAPRGQTGSIAYNMKSISVLTGSSQATVSFENPTLTIGNGLQSLKSGTQFPVTLVDPDQNINSGSDDDLDVFQSYTIIPTLTIGSPVTLENALDVQFHSISPILGNGDDSNSSVPDANSDRLVIDTFGVVSDGTYEMISMNLGISTSTLRSTLLDVSESDTDGTNWINYDLRSFENDYGISDFSDTSFTLSFGILGSFPITIVDAGDISSSQGFIQIDDSDVSDISDESGTVFLVIDFDSTGTGDNLSISSETGEQPIVFDLFSFGIVNSNDVNNSIYRFELEETSDNSSTFTGTMEYSVANQLNILDPQFIQTVQTIDDQIKFIVTNRLVDDEGISISYSDLDATGIFTTTTLQSDIETNAGTISSDSKSYRFGQPVTLTLNDPDLNLRNDVIDIYFVINDINSPNIDTVGKNGITLLEVLIKDIRYKRCTVDGVAYGGLGDTGFTLVETGPSTGIFEGVFKMPSQICNKSGTALIYSAGGSLDAKYHDSRDGSGNANVFSLLQNEPTTQFHLSAQLSAYKVVKSFSGNVEEIILSGTLDNPRRGIPLSVVITTPDGQTQNFASILSSAGNYRSVISVDEDTLPGIYKIDLFYNDSFVKTISFTVLNPVIPDWIKDNAKRWSSFDSVPDSEFINGLEYLIEEGIIAISSSTPDSIHGQKIPDWFKDNAKWWGNDQISDEDYIKSIQYLVKKGIILI